MDKTKLEQLKEEATELGISFNANIGEDKLQSKIDSFERDVAEPDSFQSRVGKAKREALKTRKVILTNLDKRDNEVVVNAYLGFENLYFDLSRIVPLDTVVELENVLITIAEETTMTVHVAEMKNGTPTGNRIPKTVNKYSITYKD